MKNEETSERDEGFLLPYIGPVILDARLKSKLSQGALAKRAGTSDATVRRIESKTGSIRPELLKRLCEALKLNYTDVVTLALIKTWRDLHGPAGVGPLTQFRERILEKFDQRKTRERDFLEEVLDYMAFILVGMQVEAKPEMKTKPQPEPQPI
jgi:transcriptional regulator with XRE-family HTH domain